MQIVLYRNLPPEIENLDHPRRDYEKFMQICSTVCALKTIKSISFYGFKSEKED